MIRHGFSAQIRLERPFLVRNEVVPRRSTSFSHSVSFQISARGLLGFSRPGMEPEQITAEAMST